MSEYVCAMRQKNIPTYQQFATPLVSAAVKRTIKQTNNQNQTNKNENERRKKLRLILPAKRLQRHL
jgi:hypothetical protein